MDRLCKFNKEIRFRNNSGSEEYPASNAYNVKWLPKGGKSAIFFTEKKINTRYENDVPGPGSYNITGMM